MNGYYFWLLSFEYLFLNHQSSSNRSTLITCLWFWFNVPNATRFVYSSGPSRSLGDSKGAQWPCLLGVYCGCGGESWSPCWVVAHDKVYSINKSWPEWFDDTVGNHGVLMFIWASEAKEHCGDKKSWNNFKLASINMYKPTVAGAESKMFKLQQTKLLCASVGCSWTSKLGNSERLVVVGSPRRRAGAGPFGSNTSSCNRR